MPTVPSGVVAPLQGQTGILGCINEHDGSGYLHALLEAYHPGYARIRSDHYRTHLAKSVRIGALPEILKNRFGPEPLCANGCAESRALFNAAMAYGSPLPLTLLRDYAVYLGTPYRLYDAELQMIDEYIPRAPSKGGVANILQASEEEYHLLVKILPSSVRGERQVNFRVLDSKGFK